jgi:peptidyl-prolyl cis-trans isomerase A (cyclophilin A)
MKPLMRGASLPAALAAMAMFTALSVSMSALDAQEGAERFRRPELLTDRAPDAYNATFDTSEGTFVVAVRREWAPNAADRFYNLVKSGFYDGNRFYRVTPLMAVWGIHGEPAVGRAWLAARISDDPTRKKSNLKGTVSFLHSNRRTTQTFINLVDNPTLDYQIPPFGEVVSGMAVVEKLHAGYGEARPTGKGPELTPYYEEGNAYLQREFPELDYINKANILAP